MLYARAGALPAIAAALALSSTPVFAQEAQPTTAEPAPTVTPAPAPTVDTAPATTDSVTAPAETTSKATKTTTKRTTRTAATKPAPVVTHTTTRAAATHATAPAAAAAPPPATSQTAAAPIAPPIVQMSAKPAPGPQAASGNPPIHLNDTELEIAGGALALLALGGGAYALMRRRRENRILAEEMAAERVESHEPEPAWHAAPAVEPAEPSAFAWGPREPADERKMTRVERARIGPTPDNPSLSLKKRLKRAAFFDQRDREMAAGNAVPVEAQAGLPETVTEAAPARDRELEAA